MGISEPWSPPRLKGVTGPGSPRCWSRIPKENPLNHPIKLKDSTSAAEITKRWYPKMDGLWWRTKNTKMDDMGGTPMFRNPRIPWGKYAHRCGKRIAFPFRSWSTNGGPSKSMLIYRRVPPFMAKKNGTVYQTSAANPIMWVKQS